MKRLVFLLALLGATGCDLDPNQQSLPARELGESLFEDPDLSGSDFNAFSCATCHSRTAIEDPATLLAGFPLQYSATRPGWWNGYETQYLDAVNFCQIYFMRGQPIVPGDPAGDALYEYLVSISPGAPGTPVSFSVVTNIQLIPGGDAANGEVLYDRACRNCHGKKGSGAGRISADATKLDPALFAEYDVLFPGIDHRLIVTEKVRHGQFFGIGGNMPFFARERLSDPELADLMTWLDL